MELIERQGPLAQLHTIFEKVEEGEGHCIFISGEAGIGKTALLKEFCRKIKNRCQIYQGTCDALFTPRPLAPLHDVLLQLQERPPEINDSVEDRHIIFSQLFFELKKSNETSLLIFEDVHWADEATLDFIKFLSRRINQLQCLFVLSYRDTEVHSHHPLTNVFGQLNSDSFSRLRLLPLSREAVKKMADEKGNKGEDVYAITGGNPFYVNEILASYSLGVPDNIKDSILSSYSRLDENTKHIWQILSVLPSAFEVKYLETMEPLYAATIHSCLELKILVIKDGLISFKHELFRRTIESSLSPFLRIELNKRILHLFRENFEKNGELERIVHHAKAANENEVVVHYAPIVAKQAAKLGAHKQASKLYLTAIEYYQGNDNNSLFALYESYAYECYLSNQIKEAIIFIGKLIQLLAKEPDIQKKGNCLRLLSRLWWLEGNKSKAESYAVEAIDLLKNEPVSVAKAMALSNMSQLKMLSDETEECIFWGDKAIEIAKELADEKILCHALNNVGTALSRIRSSREEGNALLYQSLEIALRNSYQEHVSRAYTNIGSSAVIMKDYSLARKMLEEGIQYGEEKDLNSWTTFLFSEMARLCLETGQWDQACRIADSLLRSEDLGRLSKSEALVVLAKIKMRRGDENVLPLLFEAKAVALQIKELPSMLPVLVGLLEYEWITRSRVIDEEVLNLAINMVEQKGNVFENSEFSFWLLKARNQRIRLRDFFEGYQVDNPLNAVRAAGLWKQIGCAYEQALMLFEGKDSDKRQALEIMDKLGATAVFEKMKFIMRTSGIKQLPRGIRKTTRANIANLTQRELDVLHLLKDGLQNKEIGDHLFISPKTVDHHISSILFKLDVNSRTKAVQQARRLELIK
jgi:ATP/maltotriose-dependent transcriptional regulator MalT